jgi:hypothetical protein
MANSNLKQIHIELPQWVIDEYVLEAKENGYDNPKATPHIKAEIVRQAKIKKQIRQINE